VGVLGTAGHVDHGKSALVRALTGIDPDRLPEERARGMTLDLGFAWLTLPSGREVSIVDVPGHERYVKNMLAGAGAIDVGLLVVAADEGPMPQTREPLAILELLAIPRLVVALTKVDLADEEMVALAEEEVRELLSSTPYAGSPIVPTSAVTGAGLSELLAAVDAAFDGAAAGGEAGPWLPIDRVFVARGHGVVVTGTLQGGPLRVGDEGELLPGRRRARVRGLQRHRRPCEVLEGSTRAAVNLAGVSRGDVERGMVLTRPGVGGALLTADVELFGARWSPQPLRHASQVTVLAGTAEAQARVRLLQVRALGPGERGWGQLVLDRPLPAKPGVRFVLRTPEATVGGGVVLTLRAPRRRRAEEFERLRAAVFGTPRQRALLALEGRPLLEAEVDGVLGGEGRAALEQLREEGEALERGGRWYGRAWFAREAERLREAVARYLDAPPLRRGVPREELRANLGLPNEEFDALLALAAGDGGLEARGGEVRPRGRSVQLTEAEEELVEGYLAALRDTSAPPTEAPLPPELLRFLEEEGRIVRTPSGILFHAEVFGRMRDQVVAFLERHGSVTLAQVRDMFGTSRKYAQAFLEALDAERVTRRVGDARVLLRRPERER